MATSENAALKEIFNAPRFRSVAKDTAAVFPEFDRAHFLALSLKNLDELTLLQRMRRMTESLRATLPPNYRKALAVLRELAPSLKGSFVALVLSDFVGLYGRDDFDVSMDALKFFTSFGSSEFAIREFLRLDLTGTLAVMEKWTHDEDEAVRRLASEGCRPRLPWSFRLEALIANPTPAAKILENLRADRSLFVRKSVANHLNDITKDHPGWVLDRLESWPLEEPRVAWIAKRALRTLIKKGDRQALALIGAGEKAKVVVRRFAIQPLVLSLGDRILLSLEVESTSVKGQRLVIDYRVHYVKKAGGTSAKVFKLKEFTLGAGEIRSLARRQSIQDFTTRKHHPGRHEVEIIVNGRTLAKKSFTLLDVVSS